jgi:hypothetical protein
MAKSIPGAVCQFELGESLFAYGRLYRDASIAIYQSISDQPREPPIGERSFRFVVGIYDDVPGRLECPIVGEDPFGQDEDPWPPACKVVDPITGSVQIYHRGELRPASDPSAAEGLETAAVWDLRLIVDRIRNSLSV